MMKLHMFPFAPNPAKVRLYLAEKAELGCEIPLEEVREQIEGALGQELAEAYIEEIKGGATIVEAKKADAAAPAAAEGKDAEGATK